MASDLFKPPEGIAIASQCAEAGNTVARLLKKWAEKAGKNTRHLVWTDEPFPNIRLAMKEHVREKDFLLIEKFPITKFASDMVNERIFEESFPFFKILEVITPESVETLNHPQRQEIVREWLLNNSYLNVEYSKDEIQLTNNLAKLF